MKKIRNYIAEMLIIIIITLLLPQSVYAEGMPETENTQTEENGKSNLVAHRGMSSLAPENTTPAIEMAGVYGYKGVEFDVRQTKDGKFVISHDANVSRMTNGSGLISKLTLSQIKKFKIDNGNGIENYKGLKIATLEEVLTCCKKYNLIPCIDIKNIKNVKGFLKIIKKYDFTDTALISTQKESIIKSIRKINKDISLCLICNEDGITAINRAKKLNCSGINIKYKNLNNEVADYAKQNGMSITAWTVDKLVDNYQCRKYGVDFIITNCMTDSNDFENLSVEKSYDIDENLNNLNEDSGKMNLADSTENCIATENTWFEEKNITTVNVGNNIAYNYKIMSDDIAKGNVIKITAQVKSIAGNFPHFTVYKDEKLDTTVEAVDETTGWQTVKLVYTAKKAMHIKVLFGMNESESGVFQIKNIQISKLCRYQPDSITMIDSKLVLSLGDTFDLSENIQPLNKKVIMKWKSSKSKVATVSELGCVTAKKVGKTKVTVTTENGKTSKCTVIVIPKKISALKVKNKTSQKVQLVWNKKSSATGYEIYCKETGQDDYQLVKNIKKNTKTSATIKNLKPGKKYSYKIRAYVRIDGEKYYGDFSKEIKVVTNKI